MSIRIGEKTRIGNPRIIWTVNIDIFFYQLVPRCYKFVTVDQECDMLNYDFAIDVVDRYRGWTQEQADLNISTTDHPCFFPFMQYVEPEDTAVPIGGSL